MRSEEKKEEIESYLKELESVLPDNLDCYLNDIREKACCERYFEKIIEAIIDLTFLVIKERNLKIPDEEENSFDILMQGEAISEEICNKMKSAKGMRNIIAHQYGEIDDSFVFEVITTQLIPDTKKFLEELDEKNK